MALGDVDEASRGGECSVGAWNHGDGSCSIGAVVASGANLRDWVDVAGEAEVALRASTAVGRGFAWSVGAFSAGNGIDVADDSCDSHLLSWHGGESGVGDGSLRADVTQWARTSSSLVVDGAVAEAVVGALRVAASVLAEVARSAGSGDVFLTHVLAEISGGACQAVGRVGGAKNGVVSGVGARDHLGVGTSFRAVVALGADSARAAEGTDGAESVLGTRCAVVSGIAWSGGGVVSTASAELAGKAEDAVGQVGAAAQVIVGAFGAVGDDERCVGGAVATERAESSVDGGSSTIVSFGAGDAGIKSLLGSACSGRAGDWENGATGSGLRTVEAGGADAAEKVRRVVVVGAVACARHVAAGGVGASARTEVSGVALEERCALAEGRAVHSGVAGAASRSVGRAHVGIVGSVPARIRGGDVRSGWAEVSSWAGTGAASRKNSDVAGGVVGSGGAEVSGGAISSDVALSPVRAVRSAGAKIACGLVDERSDRAGRAREREGVVSGAVVADWASKRSDGASWAVDAGRADDALAEALSVGVRSVGAGNWHDCARESSCTVVVVGGVELGAVVADGADSSNVRGGAASEAHEVGAHVIAAVHWAVETSLAWNESGIDDGVSDAGEATGAGKAGRVVLGASDGVVSSRRARVRGVVGSSACAVVTLGADSTFTSKLSRNAELIHCAGSAVVAGRAERKSCVHSQEGAEVSRSAEVAFGEVGGASCSAVGTTRTFRDGEGRCSVGAVVTAGADDGVDCGVTAVVAGGALDARRLSFSGLVGSNGALGGKSGGDGAVEASWARAALESGGSGENAVGAGLVGASVVGAGARAVVSGGAITSDDGVSGARAELSSVAGEARSGRGSAESWLVRSGRAGVGGVVLCSVGAEVASRANSSTSTENGPAAEPVEGARSAIESAEAEGSGCGSQRVDSLVGAVATSGAAIAASSVHEANLIGPRTFGAKGLNSASSRWAVLAGGAFLCDLKCCDVVVVAEESGGADVASSLASFGVPRGLVVARLGHAALRKSRGGGAVEATWAETRRGCCRGQVGVGCSVAAELFKIARISVVGRAGRVCAADCGSGDVSGAVVAGCAGRRSCGRGEKEGHAGGWAVVSSGAGGAAHIRRGLDGITVRSDGTLNRNRRCVGAVVAVWALTSDVVLEARICWEIRDDEVVLEIQGALGGDAVALAVESGAAGTGGQGGVDVGAVHSREAVDALRNVCAGQFGLEGAERAGAGSDGGGRAVRAGWARKVVDETGAGAVVALDAGQTGTLGGKGIVGSERAGFGGGSSGKRERAGGSSELSWNSGAARAVVSGGAGTSWEGKI